MIITMAAPAACARRLRSAHTRVLKCEVVTITGTRPATCSRVRSVSTSRSSSLSTNCSEKLARMQRPFEPASIMKSRQRRWLWRTNSPSSRNVVGTTGNTPLNRGAIVWLMQTSPELVATFPSRCSRTYGPTCPPRIEETRLRQLPPSVIVTRDRRAAASDQEVEIDPLVGLQDVINVDLDIAPLGRALRGLPGPPAHFELGPVHMQMQAARCNIKRDEVPVPHERKRSPSRRLGRNMQHHGAVRRARHACVRDADHVAYALLEQLRRQGHVADLRHTRVALRTAVLQDHDAARVNVERIIVDAMVQVLDVLEHDRPAGVLHQFGRGSGWLDHRPIWGKVAA